MMVKRLICCTGCAVMALAMTAPAAVARRPSSPPRNPAPPATPVETPPPPVAAATPEAPVRVGQEAEWSPEEAPRVFQGTVASPEPDPAPAPARPLPGAPMRLPSTGSGDQAVPLAGAALALGGLALVAAQPRRQRLRASATPWSWTAKVSSPSGSTFPTPS